MAMHKISPVTDEEFKQCHEWNQMIVTEFLQQQHLSNHTLKQYESGLKIFIRFVKEQLMNKPIYELKARDALKYQNYLMSIGLSSSAVKFKRSTVSSLCGYIELYYGEDYEKFRNIYNKQIPSPAKQAVNEKFPLTKEEMETLYSVLREQEEWQMIAYLKFSYASGARRSEVIQLEKEITTYDRVKDKEGIEKKHYQTHNLRTKGRGKAGKIRKLMFDDDAKNAIEKWLEVRGEDDCKYVFVKKNANGDVRPLSPSTFNSWCSGKFTTILGRRVHPHQIRSTRATHMVVNDGKDINFAKNLLGHASAETTSIYVVDPNAENVDGAFD